MKNFETLFTELAEKADQRPAGSDTVAALDKGEHFIGKKDHRRSRGSMDRR